MRATSTSSNGKGKYWFPAKRYGWGWGVPSVWQGWVVLLSYLCLVIVGIPCVQVPFGSLIYLVYDLALTALLLFVLWLKGEPLRWRWGDRDH